MSNLNFKSRAIASVFFYWLLFIFLPLFISNFFKDIRPEMNIPGAAGSYVLLIAPFLFFIPYKYSKPKNNNERMLLIFLGLIVPFLLIYSYIYIDFKRNFNLSF